MKNKPGCLGLLLLVGWVVSARPPAEDLIRINDEGQNLTERWNRAEKRAAQDGLRHAYFAYSITRMMAEGHSCIIGSRHDGSGTVMNLAQKLGEQTGPAETIKPAALARQVLDGKKGRTTRTRSLRDMALVFEMKHADGAWRIREFSAAGLDTAIHLEPIPLFWLGKCEHGDSLSWLETRLGESRDFKTQERLVAAIGLHEDPVRVLALLEPLVAKTRPEQLRKAAVFWLSQQAADKACGLLEEIAGSQSESSPMREHAVFALSQHDQGIEALIRLVRSDVESRIKKKAIFWLGQSEDERALGVILDILKH